MRPAIHWFAVPLLALVLLPGVSPIASVPEGPRLAGPGAAVDSIPLPTHCLVERNHGACVECCKVATDCDSRATFPCNVCAKFCKIFVPPPPAPEEPAP